MRLRVLHLVKVNKKIVKRRFFVVSLIFLYLKLNIFVTSTWLNSIISRLSHKHWLQYFGVEFKSALGKFIRLLVAACKTFPNVNRNNTIIILIMKILYFIQQWLSRSRLYC